MSSQTPGPTGQGPVEGGPPPEVEYLDGTAQPASRRGRRWGVAAAATVGVLGVAGAGAWGVGALMGGGPGTAQAVPADALAYLALDLDPDAGQKVEAYQFLRKFPALEERLGDGEDLRRSLVEAVLTEAPCEDLTFGDDFEPWLGDRVAVAVRPGGSADAEPVPFFVVQVTDEDAARAGVEAITACGADGGAEQPGVAFSGEHMVVAEDDATAEQVVADAEEASLADDDGFSRWVDEAGGAGVLTGYVSADAPRALMDAAEGQGATGGGMDDGLEGFEEPLAPGAEELQEQLDEALEEFEGAAMVLRFEDEGLELETAMSTPEGDFVGAGTDGGLTALPATTAVALGFGVHEDAVEQLMERLGEAIGEEELDAFVTEAETQTGLSLPEDLQTLLGDGVSFALDSSLDVSQLQGSVGGQLDVPAGIRITGDPDEIVPVLERLVAAAGAQGQVVIEAGDGAVAVGVSPDYVAELAGEGDLGDEDGFTKALPDLEDGAGGLFVDFDEGDWLTRLLQGEAEDPEVTANLEPLDSLGVTAAADGDVSRAWIRLTTD